MMSTGHSKDAPDNGGHSISNKQQRQRESNSIENRQEKKAQMSVTSDEVNYLIFRYMQESGFVHSAFSFSHESMLGRTGLRAADKTLPPGALLTFLQKGLQYVGVEESLRQQQDNAKKIGNSKKSTANAPLSLGSSSGIDGCASFPSNGDFSLLSPVAISAITRKNPPIQLTVPPAAAAAAVKARLAFEAKTNHLSQDKEDIVVGLSNLSPEPPRIVETPEASISKGQEPLTVVQISNNDNVVAPSTQIETNSPFVIPSTELKPVFSQQQLQPPQVENNISPAMVSKETSSGKIAIDSTEIRSGEAKISTLQVKQIPPLVTESQPELVDGLAPITSTKNTSNKRSSSDSKRSLKKQKTNKIGELSSAIEPADNTSNILPAFSSPGFATLKQAAEKLESTTETLSQKDSLPEINSSKNNTMQPMDTVGENDTHIGDIQNGPAHVGQQIGPLPDQMHPRNGQNADRNVNGAFSSYQPIHVSNGQAITLEKGPDIASQQQPSNASNEDVFATKDEEILTLNRHQSEVFMCAWNPVYTNLIATGSGDASARIWEMNDKYAKSGLKGCKLLTHGIDAGDRKNKDVTTLEWSSEGTLLATGSYDGVARVWDRSGALIHTLKGHQGPIFSLKWNKRGNFLLSGSYDKTIIVWNVSVVGTNGFIQHQFKDHEAPALDVDWKDNTTFASCSTDRTVHIYHVDRETPLKVYTGHTDEVNAVKWDYSGKLLASCSDDCTAKVWEVDSDRTQALHDFVSHNQEIYTVKWSPTGPGSPHPDKIPLLATASFDGSIRLWNVQDGSCCRFFNQHRDSVYSVAFSPSGDYLASGSLAGQMYIWNIAEDRFVKSYKGQGDIFEVAWNKEETRVAACFSSNVVAVIDFDPSKLPKLIENKES